MSIPGLNTLLAQRLARPWGAHRDALMSPMQAVASTSLLVALWSTTHVYKGITGDAELYALQAFSRLRPGLATDLYLQNVSQDRFTLFSPLYAWFIYRLGLPTAALFLSLTSAAAFLAGGWFVARRFSNAWAAFLAVAALLVTTGTYGSYEVFSYFEDWLTARSVAEAMVVAALACHCSGRRTPAVLIVVAAMALHPIMALPGLLLLLCLWVPLRIALAAAVAGLAAVFGFAVTVAVHPSPSGLLSVMDPPWLEVVKERSQFLFLQYWTGKDWAINSRPFLYLATYACVFEGQARRLCLAAMLVGAAGLVVAAIAGLIGPSPLLLQGQAWRWTWVTGFVGVVLLMPAAFKMWNDERCGPLCALLLILGWTFPVLYPDFWAALALLVWLTRFRLSGDSVRYLAWAAPVLCVVVLAWIAANSWTTVTSPPPETGRDPAIISDLRNILGLAPAAVAVVVLLLHAIHRAQSKPLLAAVAAVLATGTACALPGALKNYRDGVDAAQFADWRATMRPTDVVFVAPAHNSAAFAWFILERPSFLAVDQSAGVVFSRATALEVKRRSEVLLPLQAPDWRLLSANLAAKSGGTKTSKPAVLTLPALQSICRDPVLDFVVAREDVGFAPLHHTGAGIWKDWNLYACRQVRAAADPG